MNVKRILLIGLVLVAVAASLSFVAADTSVKVGGIDFSIPDGFSENNALTQDGVSGSYSTNAGEISGKASIKEFNKGSTHLSITVYEFSSPDDAKKVQDAHKENFNGTAKTINGHDGISIRTDGFGYCKDKYFIKVETNDGSLLDEVVPK